MKAEIIAVGSELLTPDRVDTNSLFLTARLNQLGIEVTRKTIVGDDLAPLRNAFEEAAKRVELIIASGGLGPTEDDRTRDAVADLLGRKLSRDPAVMSKIEARFRQLGRAMSEVNVRQAMVPEGAAVLENDRGTAPGLWIESGGRIVILLPGPPHELKAMFAAQVEPRLARLSTGVRLVARELRVAGMGESDVDQRIAPIYTRHNDVQTTILTAPGEIQIHLRAWSTDTPAAERQLQGIEESIVLALGETVFTTKGESMEEASGSGTHQASRHHRHSGELHRRFAGRAAHAHLRKLGVFSGRRGVLQQHAEIRVGGCARGNYRVARRRQQRGCHRPGRRNPPPHRRNAGRGNHGRGRPHRGHSRKARGHRACGHRRRIGKQGTRRALSR